MATRATLLLSCLVLTTLASATIEDVCSKVASLDSNVHYDFCVQSLKAAPGGSSADDRGLAVIAGNLGSDKAKNTLPKIEGLLKNATDADKGPLQDCQELYSNAVEDLKTAADAARDGRYEDANTYFTSGGIDSSTTCGDGFTEKKLKSPLAADDSELYQLAAIGASITYTGP